MSQMGGRQGNNYAHFENQEHQDPQPSAPIYAYQSESLAEQTMSRYSDQSKPPNPNNLPTRLGKNGNPHPFRNDDPDYLSQYPLGFRGCYQCGSSDHTNRRDCPMEGNKQAASTFWKELWIHKPWTKRSQTGNQ